ncbi:hypothetical protein JS531_00735 [Bifidobacterium sp. CP2]|uniref:hypothetical protein n=1 Tax=Bifidobacterium sp. CP2 TaxID=2809025 RepID=UPI001BDCDF02|nr:hypothetical protein [Bifidobacterium sp. CP2]MBT1180524.1 hypothetical protein [Bifidobacterium sp. CP2]
MRGFCQSQGSLQFNLGFFQLRSLHGDFQNGLLQHVSIMLIGKEIESQQISNSSSVFRDDPLIMMVRKPNGRMLPVSVSTSVWPQVWSLAVSVV